MRNVNELSTQERNAIRTLIKNMDRKNYDEDFIAGFFNVKKTSIERLKAYNGTKIKKKKL